MTSFLILALLFGILPASAAAATSEIEANDSSGTATHISLNAAVTGNLSGGDDEDYYSFELTQSGVIQLRFQYEAGGAYHTTIYNSSTQNKLKRINGWDFDYSGAAGLDVTQYSSRLRLPQGSYYISVEPQRSVVSGEPYKLIGSDYILYVSSTPEPGTEYEKEFNDTKDTANPIVTGKGITGNLNDPMDEDYYRFSVPESGIVQLKLQFNVGGNYDAVIRIYGTDGIYDWASKSNFKNISKTESGEVTQYSESIRLPQGDYYVYIIRGYYYDPIYDDYKLTVMYTAEPGTGYEKEFNNSAEFANIIDTNKSVIGNISQDNGTDYYYFMLPEAGSAQLQFKFAKGPYDVYLYELPFSGSQKQLMNKVFKSTSSGYIVQSTDSLSLPAGTYYVCIKSYNMSYSNTDYTLTVKSSITSSNTPSSWAQAEVSKAIEAGLVPAKMQSMYASNVTRAEFCNLAVNFISVKSGISIGSFLSQRGKIIDTSVFTDTSEYNILAAYALGIVGGRGNGIFDPNALITRQEAALMLTNTAAALGKSIASGGSSGFSDGTTVASWARNAVGYVSSLQDPTSGKYIMGGTGNNMFSPLTSYSREMSFLTFIRLFGALGS